MAWAFVQAPATGAVVVPGTSVAVAFAGNATLGNRIIVATVSEFSSFLQISVSSVTDTSGNTYTRDFEMTWTTIYPTNPTIAIWSAPIKVGGGVTQTITAHTAFSANIAMAVAEYSGLSAAAGAAAVDTTARAHANGANVSSGVVSPATSYANELLISVYGDDGGNSAITAGNGTIRSKLDLNTNAQTALQEMDSGAVFATPSGTFTNASRDVGAIAVVYFRAGFSRSPAFFGMGSALTSGT